VTRGLGGETPPSKKPHQLAFGGRDPVERRLLPLDQVRVEPRRTPHGLAGVVDLEVEPRQRRVQPPAEQLDARGVAQVHPVDGEPVPPGREVRLARVTRRRVAREPGAGHDPAAGAQEQQGGLVADLHAGAGDQRHAPAQVRRRRPARAVLVAAGAAQLIVERVEPPVGRLADVALARLGQLRPLLLRRRGARSRPGCGERGPPRRRVGARRRQLGERRREDRSLPELLDPGRPPQRLVPRAALPVLLSEEGLLELPACLQLGARDLAREPLERDARLGVHPREHGPVPGHGLEGPERRSEVRRVEVGPSTVAAVRCHEGETHTPDRRACPSLAVGRRCRPPTRWACAAGARARRLEPCRAQ